MSCASWYICNPQAWGIVPVFLTAPGRMHVQNAFYVSITFLENSTSWNVNVCNALALLLLFIYHVVESPKINVLGPGKPTTACTSSQRLRQRRTSGTFAFLWWEQIILDLLQSPQTDGMFILLPEKQFEPNNRIFVKKYPSRGNLSPFTSRMGLTHLTTIK